MLPLLLGAGLLGGAAWSAWKLIQESQNGQSGSPTPDKGKRSTEPGEDDNGQRDQSSSDRSRDELLRQIVNATEFTVQQMVIDTKVMGSERHPSAIPADDIQPRRMRNMSEIGSVVPQTHAMDEDLFYAKLASNGLDVIEHIENVDLTEDVMGESRNILIVLQDCSGSMGEYDSNDRIKWAIRLNELLLDHCIQQDAEYILFPFRSQLEGQHVATNEIECRQLQSELIDILQPGGGTNTNSALLEVLQFLQQEKFGEVRILLVTDGDDHIDVQEIRKGLDELGTYLHTVCIALNRNNDMEMVSDRFDHLPFD